jgi:hypothetical protein
VLYPRGRQFARDFPNLKATIRTDFDSGIPPLVSALKLAAAIFDSLLDQLDEDERRRALAALSEGGRAHYQKVAERRVRGEREMKREVKRDRALFISELVGAAIYIAQRMAEEGTLRFDEYADFVRRIETALGASPEEHQPLARAFSP